MAYTVNKRRSGYRGKKTTRYTKKKTGSRFRTATKTGKRRTVYKRSIRRRPRAKRTYGRYARKGTRRFSRKAKTGHLRMNYLSVEEQMSIPKGINHIQEGVFFAQSGAYAHTPESNMLKKYADMYDEFRCVKMTKTYWMQNTDNLTSAANDAIITLHSCYDPDMKGRNVNNLREIIANKTYKRQIMRPFKRYSHSVYPSWPHQSSIKVTDELGPRDQVVQFYFNESALAGKNPFIACTVDNLAGIMHNHTIGADVKSRLMPPSANGHHVYIELPADQKAKNPINFSYTYAYVFEFRGIKTDTMEYA